MSLFKYFGPSKSTSVCNKASLVAATLEVEGITRREASKVSKELGNIDENDEKKRTIYKEEEKLRVARYAMLHGNRPAAVHFQDEFPNINESSVRRWTEKYKSQLTANPQQANVSIGMKRGRPTLLSSELDEKLRRMIINLRTAGAMINIHVVRGVLAGLIRSDVKKYGIFVEFQVTRSWVRSLYARMKLSRRTATTSRPVVTRALWQELRTQYLHDIASIVQDHSIPDELILNLDQTPSKFVSASKVTMAGEGEKHISIAGGSDKRTITLTLIEALSGKLLPVQVIYKGKTERCLPKDRQGAEDFLFSYNDTHWSNEKETIRVIDCILVPYIERVKTDLKLPKDQKCLLIWDAFTGQNTPKVKARLAEVGILTVMVPKNLTHLLQPLDVTTNATLKKMERNEFSKYFTSVIMQQLLEDPNRDVTTIKVDLKLTTLKPLHLQSLKRICDFFKTVEGHEIIRSGFRFTGITNSVKEAREGAKLTLDPY